MDNNQQGNVVWDYAVLRDDIRNLQTSVLRLHEELWALRQSLLEGLRSIRALIEGEVNNPIGGGGDADDV
ncbi:hypothetical protein HAX54_027828, partial [Datura stramonium]|nr:hypothetical protein [Datura stramonium]